jgi:2,4-dienoyl-CoA reductase-like NADH-dependent reductase (Old Yellow Enzyme family)/thioredoxin reductase
MEDKMSGSRDTPVKRFSSLFQPGNIGKLRLENRLVMAPMANPLLDTERRFDYYRARAQGGVGLITTQAALVSPEFTPRHNLPLYDDRFIPDLRRLVQAIHGHAARVSIQLAHTGMILLILPSVPEDTPIKVPSIMPWLPGDKIYKEINETDIDRYVEDFSEAARRAKEAGADAIELHACHGSLVGTFLSPVTNRRTDHYGGTLENRTRFARRIVERIKEKVGAEFPVSVRINGDDDVQGGITPDEVVRQAVILESAGADAIHITAGFEFWAPLGMPSYAYPEGPMVPMTEKVKKAVRVPLITAGKIGPELAEQLIRNGKADFIAMGRPLLADPELPNKLREGRVEDIRWCIYCNNCIKRAPGNCSVNPFLYKEARFPPTPTKSPKKVMVVGAGLAGMQAAVVLAQQGHQVSLYEKSSELGGQWKIASAMPGKKGYAALTDYLRRSLHKYGVSVILGTEVTKEQVLAVKPDVVVVATGAVPAELNVPRARSSNVVQANDIIKGQVEAKGRVVVIGGRSLGMEMAVWLAEQGKKVSLVSRSGLGGRKGPAEKFTYRTLVRRLIELRIPLYLNTTVLEITDRSVVIGLGDEVFSLPADMVILAIGAEPDKKLAQELEGVIPNVHMIGDCVEPRDAAAATWEAAKLAFKI